MAIPWWVKSTTAYAVSHPAEAAVILYAARYAPVPLARIAWATAAEMGPATLRLGGRVTVIGYESSFAVRAGVTAARFAAAAGVGYAIGSAVGIGIAYAGWGMPGAKDAAALYSGQVSWSQYSRVVGGALSGLP